MANLQLNTAPAGLTGILVPGDGATLTALSESGDWPAATTLRVQPATGAEQAIAATVAGTLATWTLTVAQVSALIGTRTTGSLEARITHGTGDALRPVAAGRLSILSRWAGIRAAQSLGTVVVGPTGPPSLGLAVDADGDFELVAAGEPGTALDAAVAAAAQSAIDAAAILAVSVRFDQAQTLTAPQKVQALANAGAHPAALTGTGTPEGVVTAPVGTYYEDAAGTRGAWKWQKRATAGNTGWRVVEADTGWLDMTASLANGWTATRLLIRRAGYRCYLRHAGLNGSAATSTVVVTTNNGFAPTFSVVFPARTSAGSGTSDIAAKYVTDNTITAAMTITFSASEQQHAWVTDQTWPDALPGTPA